MIFFLALPILMGLVRAILKEYLRTSSSGTAHVLLYTVGPEKIKVIRAIREAARYISLSEAAEMVSGELPVIIVSGVSEEFADALVVSLVSVGARAEKLNNPSESANAQHS